MDGETESRNSKVKRKLESDGLMVDLDDITSKRINTKKSFILEENKTIYHNLQRSNSYYDHWEYEIKDLKDLILLGNFYSEKNINKKKTHNIPFFKIYMLRDALQSLINMVGLEDMKQQILKLIVFYLQDLDEGNQDMLHTVVYGGPGVGKTKFINILSEIYANLGVLSECKVTFAKRADMVGQYLGHTAVKTKLLIEKAMGGILVIDEAYSLGDTEQKDSFSRECIDTLNQYLSESKKDLVCIIAGYKDDLERRFFNTNPGLARRFPFKFTIPDYSPTNLKDIFLSIVQENKWKIDDNAINVKLLEEYRDYFPFNGGDMELMFTKVKFIHSMRVFSEDPGSKKIITRIDFEKALEEFVDNDSIREQKYIKDYLKLLYI
jgi:SpoVK/Ycf46/Vps4 family AAA+-type ATPase